MKIEGSVRVDAYAVISRAVEEGIAYGWHRVLKYHIGKGIPDEARVQDEMERAITNALCEVLKFDE